ncbi:MAG: valine--tRNA ligase [Sphingomonadales bacterium]
MLDKSYRPAEVETELYDRWEKSGAFKSGRRPDAETFTIVIPPPNVTGSLHMGHALNSTIQDILIRYNRMRGLDTLWQPGCDHAGIATQMVVERQLAEQGLDRRELGREEFVRRVWEWKEKSGGMITRQLRRLGASCDWSRERFTMDEGLSEAVLKVFIELYRQGLIYKDKRLVNWDPKLLTAISDLEVDQREVQGHLWHFRYPIEGEDGRYIVVATTRPETMLGDTAVAVHPEDERYKDLIGKYAVLPLVGRRIRIVADEHADPEQGSGAVKITPAHDFNDFEVGRRHDLERINIFDRFARLNDNVPEPYQGLERYEARERVVAELDALGLLDRIDDHLHTVPYGDRSGVAIEPWLTDQWYVNAQVLAKPALEAVENGDTKIFPKQWEKTYFEWMRNIQPWCISRQLWWGHQIPAWYGPDGEIFVGHDEDEALELAKAHYGEEVKLERDPDVLDTWFSSALWPFSTLGWPDQTPELERFYKTDVLVTAFDILFFWVARMMMSGLHFMKDADGKPEAPFHTVYIHALVRDEQGRKMSKSLGNVVDPLILVDKYGADALRFALAAMAAPGRDVKLAEKRIEGYRNFCTKLWNVARFSEMNGCRARADFDPLTPRQTVNRWIVAEVAALTRRLDDALTGYRFDLAANDIYQFVWGTFCDWYVEFIKPLLMDGDGAAREETQATAGWALDHILKLLHPFMPFVTEELWGQLSEDRDTMLILADWPTFDAGFDDPAAREEMNWVIRVISEIRAVRAEVNIPAGAKIPAHVKGGGELTLSRLASSEIVIKRLARLDSVETVDGAVPAGSVQVVVDETTIALPLAGVIDIAAERERISKEIKKADSEIAGIDKRLANKGFLSKAPAHVVETQRERRAEAEVLKEKLSAALRRLA